MIKQILIYIFLIGGIFSILYFGLFYKIDVNNNPIGTKYDYISLSKGGDLAVCGFNCTSLPKVMDYGILVGCEKINVYNMSIVEIIGGV